MKLRPKSIMLLVLGVLIFTGIRLGMSALHLEDEIPIVNERTRKALLKAGVSLVSHGGNRLFKVICAKSGHVYLYSQELQWLGNKGVFIKGLYKIPTLTTKAECPYCGEAVDVE